MKKKAVFALSQLPKDEGVPQLMEVARNNRNPAVRKQAMFWLGQSKDPRAVKFFEEILTPEMTGGARTCHSQDNHETPRHREYARIARRAPDVPRCLSGWKSSVSSVSLRGS